jgi:type II secretory pathway pseudopilin PulG
MGLMQAQNELPPDARPLIDSVNLISAAELTLNLSHPAPSSLVMHANDESAANQVEDLLKQASEKMRDRMRADLAPQMASPDPVQRAFAQYMERLSGRWTEPLMPKRDGAKLTIFRVEAINGPQQQYMNVAVIGVLVALLLPAVQAAREAARRNASINNMKEIELALLNYHDVKKKYPPNAIYSADGKPLLSWRVAILPYIDQLALYNEFHMDEPWDSPHNKSLIPRMPSTFANPNMPNAEGRTTYLAVVGKECVFDGTEKGKTLRQITDGTSKTINIVEADADRAVEWTKPYDLNFDASNPKAGLGHVHPGGWLAAFCDGHIQFITESVPADMVKAMFTCAGGERYELP